MQDKVEVLWAIEQIRQLKARYFRALDGKDWTLFAECLSEDCEGNYSDGRLVLNGREAITGFMQKHMSSSQLLSMHNGHHPEIEVNSADTATGVWYLHDQVYHLESKTWLSGAAIYSDEYRREGDQWRISKTGYKRLFEWIEPVGENQRLQVNCFDS